MSSGFGSIAAGTSVAAVGIRELGTGAAGAAGALAVGAGVVCSIPGRTGATAGWSAAMTGFVDAGGTSEAAGWGSNGFWYSEAAFTSCTAVGW